MRHHLGRADDFVELVGAFPGGVPKLRQYVLGGFGIFIPESVRHPWDFWRVLVEQKGPDRAADILAEIIVTQCGPRVLELVKAWASEDGGVFLRADDPEIAHVLFESEDLNDDLGYFLADYWNRSRGPDAGPGPVPRGASPEGADLQPDMAALQEEIDQLRNQVEDLTSSDLDETLTGSVETYRPSAPLNSGLGFERVDPRKQDFVTADPSWLEQDLEDFLCANWESIDFGVEGPLVLFGRQMRLTEDSLDRVDILAKGPRGTWYAIELKIVEARSRDLTQLGSYVGQLVQRGVPQDRARGLLIAPAFGSKVVSAAAIQPYVELLRFRAPGR
jgi:hypothetical protein